MIPCWRVLFSSADETVISTVSARWCYSIGGVRSTTVLGQFRHSWSWFRVSPLSLVISCTSRSKTQPDSTRLRRSDSLLANWQHPQHPYGVIDYWPMSRVRSHPGTSTSSPWRQHDGRLTGSLRWCGAGGDRLRWKNSWTNCVYFRVWTFRGDHCYWNEANKWPDVFHAEI